MLLASSLAAALSGCFSAPPQIISLEPNRGSTSVPADAPVQVVFDRPVRHGSLVGRLSVQPQLPGCDLARVFSLPPDAPCSVRWLSSPPGFVLVHDGAVFAPATRYTFTLAGGFSDDAGDSNDLDHHWDLTSAPAPAVTATTPAARAAGIPLDTPLSVTFNAPMDPIATAAAISLDPPVPGTRVLRNGVDRSRFVILPGRLLDPGLQYTLRVSAAARGSDQQRVAAPLQASFTTGSAISLPHVAVLAAPPSEAATEVLLPALAPAATGEPVVAPTVMQAARCQLRAGCGRIAAGEPLETYAAATVSPDASRLAVVVDDIAAAISHLQVVALASDSVLADIAGASLPSWSPTGDRLAFSSAGQVQVLDLRTRALTRAAATTEVGPPLWAAAATVVITSAPSATDPGGVRLVDPELDASYQLPGSVPGSAVAALAPQGSVVAVVTPRGDALLLAGPGSAAAPRNLGLGLEPVGFTQTGALMALGEVAGAVQLVRINTATGDVIPVDLPAGTDLQSIRLAPDGRRLVFLAPDAAGVQQAYVADDDGSGVTPLTRFLLDDVAAVAAAFAA